MGERYRPATLEEREITDGIAALQRSSGLTGCPDHKTVVAAQVLSLRIGENTIYRLQELGDAITAAAKLAADAVEDATEAVKAARERNAEPSKASPWKWGASFGVPAPVCALIYAIGSSKGWW